MGSKHSIERTPSGSRTRAVPSGRSDSTSPERSASKAARRTPLRASVLGLLVCLATPLAVAVDVKGLWDYNRPDASEKRFRAALAGAHENERHILQTQIARTWGMRRDFAQARAILATVEPRLSAASAEVRVRYFLELGRTHFSPMHPPELQTPESRERARASFMQAFELAKEARLDSLAIDALHMMPFVEVDPDRQHEWNEKALRYIEASDQADARAWEAALRNNVGVAKRSKGDHEGALREFRLSRAAYERTGTADDVRIADWMIARTYRDQKRYGEALDIQLRLEREFDQQGNPDPHVYAELEQLYRALGKEDLAQGYASKRKAAQR